MVVSLWLVGIQRDKKCGGFSHGRTPGRDYRKRLSRGAAVGPDRKVLADRVEPSVVA